jgi:hypothetical protein
VHPDDERERRIEDQGDPDVVPARAVDLEIPAGDAVALTPVDGGESQRFEPRVDGGGVDRGSGSGDVSPSA